MDAQERLEICVDMGPWQRCPLPTDLHLILGTRLLGNTPESEGDQDGDLACHVIYFISSKSKEKAERREHRDVITGGFHKTKLGPGWSRMCGTALPGGSCSDTACTFYVF